MSDAEWKYDPKKWATHKGWAYDDGLEDEPRIEVARIPDGHMLYGPISNLVARHLGRDYYYPREPIHLVTEGKWSGYSEYTITDEWSEVHVHCDGTDLHWEDMGAFMRDLADANPPGERY